VEFIMSMRGKKPIRVPACREKLVSTGPGLEDFAV